MRQSLLSAFEQIHFKTESLIASLSKGSGLTGGHGFFGDPISKYSIMVICTPFGKILSSDGSWLLITFLT